MFCEKCRRVYEGSAAACPVCGSRKVRYPRVDDACFLTELESIWGEMLADVLGRNGVPYLKNPVLGAGLTLKLGQGMERWRFYVPFDQLDKARDLVSSMFPEEE